VSQIFRIYLEEEDMKKNYHIEKGQLHKCEHCENTYSSLDSLKRHIKINHNSVASVCVEQMQHTL
jgi:hypothetical protein